MCFLFACLYQCTPQRKTGHTFAFSGAVRVRPAHDAQRTGSLSFSIHPHTHTRICEQISTRYMYTTKPNSMQVAQSPLVIYSVCTIDMGSSGATRKAKGDSKSCQMELGHASLWHRLLPNALRLAYKCKKTHY